MTIRHLAASRRKIGKPSPEAVGLARQLRHVLSMKLGKPVKVMLYGSQARGAATEESDIDILVILPNLEKYTLDITFETAWELGFKAGKVLSIVPVTGEEMIMLSASPFFQAVKSEGISV